MQEDGGTSVEPVDGGIYVWGRLMCKLEDLSLLPSKRGLMTEPCNPSTREVETGEFLGLAGQSA